jgi:GMP synthase (glutamine-hydrolysing)
MRPVLALRHVPHESLGLLETVFHEGGLEFLYVDLFEGRKCNLDPREAAGLVVLGGPMNVDQTDKFPFLATELHWLQRALAANVPVLGICLGSQLLARSLGAKVYPNPVKEIGWYDVQLTEVARSDPLLNECQAIERVFQWHGDTFDLPAGAVHLAASPRCRHQAFRYGRSAWGLQFHWEVTAEMVQEWLVEPGNHCELSGLDYIDATAIRARLSDELPGLHRTANKVLGKFAAVCRERG